ncbi:NAD(P)/FAD-dependent oxidoreductase [Candidatus Pacearchaeota archaeon]|nr:NAD(P)/FAD-dependent oxidoreductase [Candidatus Pacearchaeota archaeon]
MKYDLIVIGTGSAGATVAGKCRRAGWSVAIIDSLPFGGTCALRGCDPKKIFVGVAEIIDRSIDMKDKGIAKEPEIKWSDLMEFKKSFIEPRPKMREQGFQNSGIDTYHGKAFFVDKNIIQVGNSILEGRYILIATGASPIKLNVQGEEYISISDDFLDMDNMPENIIFIGGGYISFELAHVAAKSGAKVRILHRSDKVLKRFDPDLVNILINAYKSAGIEIQINMPVNSVEKKDKKLIVYAGNDSEHKFESDMVVHGAGRTPKIHDLNLNKAGIDFDKKGIVVNEYLQSVSNPAVYVAGDANAGGIPLTPVAGMEGKIVAQNILEGNKTKPDYSAIPSVVFSVPPLASVGILEEDAEKQKLNYKINYEDTSPWYTSKRIGLKYSGFKVIIDKKTNQILGAHLLGNNVDEVINIFAMAMKTKITADKLKDIIFAYPTAGSDIKYMV